MRRKIIYWPITLFLCLFGIFPKVVAREHAAYEPTGVKTQIPLTLTRPDTGKPTEVAVGFYLVDFEKIEDKVGIFEIDAYLHLTWKDKRLVFDPEVVGANIQRYNIEEIWSPNVRFLNVMGEEEQYSVSTEVSPDGTVQYRQRFTGKFFTDFYLRKFPFDSQTLKIIVISDKYDEKEVVFTVLAVIFLRQETVAFFAGGLIKR